MATTVPTEGADAKAETVEAYLRDRVNAGDHYFKSRFIADDVDLSAKEIGAAIATLQRESDALAIEKWSYSNGTTWRIRPADAVR